MIRKVVGSIRYYGGAYIARANGLTASSTSDKKWAIQRVCEKVAGTEFRAKAKISITGNKFIAEVLEAKP